MRQIKFRIFDKKHREWVHDTGHAIDLLGETIIKGEILCRPDGTSVTSDELRDLEVMQFTGQYDVNGREIYEGDIIKHRYFGIKGLALIQWSDDEASFLAIDSNGARVLLRPNCEIIGNIYDNKELLT